MISVIIPVYQEQAIINSTLDAILSQKGVDFEIIVVDSDRDHSTLKAILSPDIKTLHTQKGRAIQMNAGAALSQGDILVFLHADTQLPPQGLSLIQEQLDKNLDLCGGAFDLGFGSASWPIQLFAKISSWRSRKTQIPYGDQAIFIRKSVFNQLGGYPEIPVMEDVALMKKIKSKGLKLQFFRQKVTTSTRRWNETGWIKRTALNWWMIWRFNRGTAAKHLARYYSN